jgi:hypothetical protein
MHQFGQGLFAVDIGFGHFDTRLNDQRLVTLASARRNGDFNTALRQAIGDIGTDETATPSSKTFLMSIWNPGNYVRKT